MNKPLFLLVMLSLLFAGNNVLAMSSTHFLIPWDNVNSGGLDRSSSTNFSSTDSIGGTGSGTSTSANFQLSAGYRAPEGVDTLTYQVSASSASVSRSYTGFNAVGNTVTVSSAAGFSVGNLIAVSENADFSRYVAVGRISSIVGLVISVDRFDGDGALMNAVPAGGDDKVFLLNSNSINFGSIVINIPYTSIVGTSVLSNVSTGYTLYLLADQELQNATAQVFSSVADGSVTLGSEEYGAETTGATAFSSGTDLAVTATQRIVQTSGAATGPTSDKIGMVYKLSISPTTNAGTYSQNVYYTLTANY